MGKRILVVDDEPVVLESVKRALRKDDFDIDTVERADEALKRLETEPYQLIITDLMMPGVDGLELLKRLKDMGLETETIMITGYPTIQTALKAKRLGAFEYVSKPFTREELRSAVVRAIRHRASDPPPAVSESSETTYYIPDHSWLRKESDDSVIVGMARVFATTLGRVAALVLPESDAVFEQGRAFMGVRAEDGIEHSLHCPISGKLMEVNPLVKADAALSGTDPEGRGWLVRVAPENLERELLNLVAT